MRRHSFPCEQPSYNMTMQAAPHTRELAIETPGQVADHYAALTDALGKYTGDMLACHYGLWGPDTTSERDALVRSNQRLVEGCGLGPGGRILDAGCGIGGTAIFLAEKHGAHVSGLTICEPHVEAAAEHAQRRGVSHLVDFRYGDFMDMPYADATFDAVLNHESFCYAPDKPAYLRGVHRVLKPGGRWQAVDFYLSGGEMREDEREIAAATARYSHSPPLVPWRDVTAMLKEAGFEDIREEDLSAEVLPATEKARKRWLLFVFMANPGSPPPYSDLQWATIAVEAGLRKKIISCRFISGARPG